MEAENTGTQQVSNETQSGKLLNAEQRAVCEQIAAGDGLDSQRALRHYCLSMMT